ncbi:MAG: ribulose bisphosphate carboxylase small subunit, partial [Acidobacteria bacterium]|nr:ribulose bisphosphate carboxylase small subunit [Acidobacteriota bacterium]
TFSFLPDCTDEQIASQIDYCLRNGWSLNVEYTDDPHPRNAFWEMWRLPMFDIADPVAILAEVKACRAAHPNDYIKVNAHNSTRGRETVALSFIVNRPKHEPGFRLDRQETHGRSIRYTVHSYAADRPEGERYGNGQPPEGEQ